MIFNSYLHSKLLHLARIRPVRLQNDYNILNYMYGMQKPVFGADTKHKSVVYTVLYCMLCNILCFCLV